MKTFFLLYFVLTQYVFSVSPFLIDGPSMEPTLQDDEIIIINKNFEETESLKRGDLVVFSFSEDPDYFYVKRIIGLPGEKLHIKEDGIYIDNDSGEEVKLNEPYLFDGASSALKTESYRENSKHTYAIPHDKYFVLGDNRAHSLDSRYFKTPFVKKSNIKGKYLFNLTDL